MHGNIATNNTDGFYIVAQGEISDNLAGGNTQHGIFTGSVQGNVRITHNTAVFNGSYGITAGRNARGNEITSNTALGNGTYDLFDDNSICQNTWADNVLGTSKGPCIH